MSRSVWKYEVPIDDNWHEVLMPKAARLLHVGQQNRLSVCVWADVDPTAPNVPRQLRVFGTGHYVPESARYIGTVQIQAMPLVWHLFESAP
jgi:hypothetical protein